MGESFDSLVPPAEPRDVNSARSEAWIVADRATAELRDVRGGSANNRVASKIKDNDYRLVVLVRYDKGLMYVRFVGTHSQYDRIDVSKV